MSLIGVILGSIFQLGLSVFLFMLAAFAGGGIVSGRNLSELQIRILDISLYALPCLCLISAGIVVYQYTHGGTNNSYWWYCMPIAAAIIYIIYVSRI